MKKFFLDKCDRCQDIAIGRYAWGTYDELKSVLHGTETQVEDLCGFCADELWQTIRDEVKQGTIKFAITKFYDKTRI